MARRTSQPEATREEVLECVQQTCPWCGGWMWNKYDNVRRVRTLEGVVQLRLKVRRCATPECERFCQPYRPEAEGKWVLPLIPPPRERLRFSHFHRLSPLPVQLKMTLVGKLERIGSSNPETSLLQVLRNRFDNFIRVTEMRKMPRSRNPV